MSDQTPDPLGDVEAAWAAIRRVEQAHAGFHMKPSQRAAERLLAAVSSWLADIVEPPTTPVATKTAAQLIRERREAGLTAADIPKNYSIGMGNVYAPAITSVGQLDALPYPSLIRERDGFMRLKRMDGTWLLCVPGGSHTPASEIELPAEVLYAGKVN